VPESRRAVTPDSTVARHRRYVSGNYKKIPVADPNEYSKILLDSKDRSIVQDITGNVTPTMSNMASARPMHAMPRAPPSYNTATRMNPIEPTTETYDYELNAVQKNKRV
jgi:hypothetical protein